MYKKMITILIFSFLFRSLIAPPFPAIDIPRSNYLNMSNIDYEMSKYDILFPEIVKAQIRHETGNLTSRFCREQNNLFGMRSARLRETKAIGEGNHMAIYRSWQESIEDYSLWQKRYYKGGDYFDFLKNRYAEDKDYIKKLKRLI